MQSTHRHWSQACRQTIDLPDQTSITYTTTDTGSDGDLFVASRASGSVQRLALVPWSQQARSKAAALEYQVGTRWLGFVLQL